MAKDFFKKLVLGSGVTRATANNFNGSEYGCMRELEI